MTSRNDRNSKNHILEIQHDSRNSEILEIQNDSRNSIWFLEILEIIFKKFWNFRNQWLLETIEITKSSFQWQLQVSLGSCNLPLTQATSCSPSGLPLSRSHSSANHSVFYSIHPFSTLLVLCAFCCCSPHLLSVSLASEAGCLFFSPIPLRLNPSFLLQFFPSFPSSISIFYPSPPVPQLKLVRSSYFPYFF